MTEKKYDIALDPEANALYSRCADVDGDLWKALEAADPGEVCRRTGAEYVDGTYRLSYLNRQLAIQAMAKRLYLITDDTEELGFQLGLVTLLYLLKITRGTLPERQVSPREFKGGTTFFQGPHALPVSRLEARYGQDRQGFLEAGTILGGKPNNHGDAGVFLKVFSGIQVGLILWLADEEFPAQVSLTVPAALEQYWQLDAIWAMLNVVTREMLQAGEKVISRQ
jgi:hypothetical protein